jgi:bifunctional NMN adenylyltransferase/nudix hydrolase
MKIDGRLLTHIIFLGRFQPFHVGHLSVVTEALRLAEKLVVLIGSANRSRDERNPWLASEREAMIRACLNDEQNSRVICLPLDDAGNNEIWVSNVRALVGSALMAETKTIDDNLVGLIGHKKDETSFYLDLFPQWQTILMDSHRSISATPLRESFFLEDPHLALESLSNDDVLPLGVIDYLRDFAKDPLLYPMIRELMRQV